MTSFLQPRKMINTSLNTFISAVVDRGMLVFMYQRKWQKSVTNVTVHTIHITKNEIGRQKKFREAERYALQFELSTVRSRKVDKRCYEYQSMSLYDATQSDKIYKITRFYAFKCAVSTISKTFFFYKQRIRRQRYL